MKIKDETTKALIKQFTELSKKEMLEYALEAMKESEDRAVGAEKELKKVSEKAKFADMVLQTEKWVTVQEASKIMNIKDIGPNKLFSFLRAEGVLMNTTSRWNVPYERYVQQGYFKIIEEPFQFGDSGDDGLHLKPAISQKGLDFIRRIIEEAQNGTTEE